MVMPSHGGSGDANAAASREKSAGRQLCCADDTIQLLGNGELTVLREQTNVKDGAILGMRRIRRRSRNTVGIFNRRIRIKFD